MESHLPVGTDAVRRSVRWESKRHLRGSGTSPSQVSGLLESHRHPGRQGRHSEAPARRVTPLAGTKGAGSSLASLSGLRFSLSLHSLPGPPVSAWAIAFSD